MPHPERRATDRRLARATAIAAIMAAALGAFCWWGMFTAAGLRHFDEMDGLYPFFAGVAGALAAGIALLLGLTILWRRRG